MPSGIEILKLLPKTNCGDCGQPTCLAFAMNIAAGKMELAACPYVSEEARAALAESSAPAHPGGHRSGRGPTRSPSAAKRSSSATRRPSSTGRGSPS